MVRPRVDLPQPDSPTRPKVSPLLISMVISSLARTYSCSFWKMLDLAMGKYFLRFVIDKSFFQINGVPVDTLYFRPAIQDPRLLEFLGQIADRYENLDWDSFQDILTLRTLFQQLIELLCREYLVPKPANSHGSYVRSALEYLSRNKAKRITLDDVADAIGVSKYHLAHQFKLYTQKSIMQVLMQMRLEEAWRMLRKGASISETAAACGFESLPYFSTSFKKRFGITPSQCVDNKAAQYRLPGNKGIGQ